jgi:hypothetical protein
VIRHSVAAAVGRAAVDEYEEYKVELKGKEGKKAKGAVNASAGQGVEMSTCHGKVSS